MARSRRYSPPTSGPTSSPALDSPTSMRSTTPKLTSPTRSAVVPPESTETYIDRGRAVPDTYGDDRLVAFVRDPHWIFVYWELDGEGLARLRDLLGADACEHAQWVLRLDDGSRGVTEISLV